MSLISLDWLETRYSDRTRELLDMLSNDPTVLTHINQIIGTALNQFVPMQTGVLRESMYADSIGVHWNTPYAHYQYEGEVYGINFPIRVDKTIIGWRSKPGVRKSPTGRELGVPGVLDDWTFGYSTPGTMHHWDAPYTGRQWGRVQAGQSAIKADTNQKITAYLKAECKRRGF